jgi:hypothetical protein
VNLDRIQPTFSFFVIFVTFVVLILHFATWRLCVRLPTVRQMMPIVLRMWLAVIGLAFGACHCVVADEAAKEEPPITQRDREHWAFRPLSAPAVPHVGDTSWPRNPIDQFVLAALRDAGLEPSPEADRVMLIRRITLDLTGLPPTPEEVDRFLADSEPDAYERVIDRLLARSAYGERWAQHWLDLARFAETDGFEHDHVRPDAWKYRDWVIEALNTDMPYGEFVRLQIAGDLVRPGDESAAVATGFALAGPDMPDINLEQERRHMVLNDITATVGSVFLGLTIGCAECHDHKYDPISQADFYRLRAFFEPALHFDKHTFGRVLREVRTAESARRASHICERGDFRRPGPQVEPAYPRIAIADSQLPSPSTASTPPRAALANWLASNDNFLATRVIVNRLWQHHFGRGLVRSPSDFGVMGDAPSHPQLLDWLAGELVRRGGSLKQMHKLMLTSATYRQCSRPLENPSPAELDRWKSAAEVDPDNRLLWHAERQRLEGEAIRDSMLAAAEKLSPRTGGRGVMPPLPDDLTTTLLKDQWIPSPNEEDHRRRSIYLFARRNLRFPIFEAFDRPETNASCPVRSQSTIAPQALLLLNSEFSLNSARDLAEFARNRGGEDRDAQINLVYRRALCRPPTTAQLERARIFLTERDSVSADSLALCAWLCSIRTSSSTSTKVRSRPYSWQAVRDQERDDETTSCSPGNRRLSVLAGGTR